MKIKMYLLKTLKEAVDVIAEQRVKGMQRYVFELTEILNKELRFWAQENDKILKEHGEKDEQGKLKISEQGFIKIATQEGKEALTVLNNEETGDLPEMSLEQGELLATQYALTRLEYALLKGLVKNNERSDAL